MENKFCPKCQTVKPMSDFQKDKFTKDGHNWRCAVCAQEYQRKMRSRPGFWERQMAYSYARRDSNREHFRLIWKKKKPSKPRKRTEKDRTRMMFRNAVLGGKIQRRNKCSDCGSTEIIQAHHDDYSKPFDVEWLCSICHGKRHRKYAATINKVLGQSTHHD